MTHAATGAYLLALWGLPLAVVEAVAGHHDLGILPGESLDATVAVHVADVLAHEARPELGDGTPPPSVDLAYLERLGVTDQLHGWRELAAAARPHARCRPRWPRSPRSPLQPRRLRPPPSRTRFRFAELPPLHAIGEWAAAFLLMKGGCECSAALGGMSPIKGKTRAAAATHRSVRSD